jgi:hypothetical protein
MDGSSGMNANAVYHAGLTYGSIGLEVLSSSGNLRHLPPPQEFCMFTSADIEDFQRRGMELHSVERQLERFRQGQGSRDLCGPAGPGKGILLLPKERHAPLLALHDQAQRNGRLSKFVPASGAATRMFKVFFEAQNHLAQAEKHPSSATLHDLVAGGSPEWKALRSCMVNLPRFAFYPQLREVLAQWGYHQENPQDLCEIPELLDALLSPAGLDFAHLPKGLVPFHLEEGVARTAFQEHLLEALEYIASQGKKIPIHFTVSEEHLENVRHHLEPMQTAWPPGFDLSFSVQDPASDTLAVDPRCLPFREASGRILFRPGGHGALLKNLQECGGDLVFIKNIDNTVPARSRAHQAYWKRLLGGVLVDTVQRLGQLAEEMERGEPSLLPQWLDRYESLVGVRRPEHFLSLEYAEQHRWLVEHIHRPTRVCGMVVNQGEPGGGPFWVKSADGSTTLQIVEKAEIDVRDAIQREHLNRSSHFNPVDMVCSLRDRAGRPWPLHRFVDENSFFISQKSHLGRPLQALEWPGLWNGAMAGWNTVFVEVPLETFNPVKEVQDLLRPEHSWDPPA